MFEKRRDLIKFLAVVETGAILAAADKLGISQPALSRVIARIERQFGGRLFERLPTGVRLTPLGVVVADLARHILFEIEAAEDQIEATLSGRTGCLRVTAGPIWMQAILPVAVARFHKTYPGVEFKLLTTTRPEGIRLLTDGETDLHCGGVDADEPLPQFLKRERLLDMSWGVVAHKDHPLHSGPVSDDALADYPWIDYDASLRATSGGKRPVLTDILNQLHERTGRRVRVVIRAGSAGLSLMGTGPYLSWLSLPFLERLPDSPLKPLSVAFGTRRYRVGIVSRRSSEDRAPFGLFKSILREEVSANSA